MSGTEKPNKPSVNDPHGLGDPDDTSLRIVEKEVLIPKIMRERAKKEKCVPEVEAFTKCCASNSVFMVYACRKENTAMQDCQSKWYQDEGFKTECKEIYLKDRREFRLTGVPKKHRQKGDHHDNKEDLGSSKNPL